MTLNLKEKVKKATLGKEKLKKIKTRKIIQTVIPKKLKLDKLK